MKKYLKSAVSILLAGIMALSMAACGSSGSSDSTTAAESAEATTQAVADNSAETEAETESEGPKEPVYHSLRIGTSSTLASMSPFAVPASRGPADMVIYETLATLDKLEDGKLVGIIAKSWETIDDGTTWDVEIYDNVYDTNGNHITAEDVNFCAQNWIGKSAMAKCAACEVLDEYKVRITLINNGIGNFTSVMKGFSIVSQKEYEASPDGMATAPVGTSPYVVTDYVAGGYITMEKTNNYWQTDESLYGPYSNATVDQITYVTIQEAAQMTIALETGTVDAINEINQSEVSKFEEGGQYSNDFTMISVPNTQTYSLHFSGGKTTATGDDLNLRLAIAYAIDKDGLITGAMNGRATRVWACGSPVLSDCPSERDEYFEYDPEKAKEYLAKSNYNGESIRIMCTNQGVFPKVCQIIEACLEAVGINAEVNAYDNALAQTYQRDPEAQELVLTATGINDYVVTSWYSVYSTKSNDGEKTIYGWVNPELEALMDEVIVEETHTIDRIDAVQEIIDENMYSLGLFYSYAYSIWNNNTNIENIPIGYKGNCIWWCTEFND